MVRVRGSCKGWKNGLGNHQLINDGAHWNVPVPTLWELGIRNNWFDFVKFTSQCNKQHQVFDKSILNDNIKNREGLSLVGYPRTEWLPFDVLATQSLYRSTIRNQIIDMNDPNVSQDLKDNIEFTVDISNPQASILNLNLKPNITRAEEQRKLRNNIIKQEKADGTYNNRMDKNVLIIYLDNLSRAHFYRKMPKTAEFINQFVDNQDSDISAHQFFRYHSVFYNTLYSNDAMYYGQIGPLSETSTGVFDSYSNNGYITGFFKDACESHSNSIKTENPTFHRWDHMGGGISWDKNYDDDDFTSLSVFTGKNSAIRRWLYGKNMHEIQLDYLKQFWGAYPNNRKFFRTHFSEGHVFFGKSRPHPPRRGRVFLTKKLFDQPPYFTHI